MQGEGRDRRLLRARTDHVGSLLRPPALLAARSAWRGGRLMLDALRQAEDAAIQEALALQRQVGIGHYTDGEYRRSIYSGIVVDAVAGFGSGPNVRRHWHGPRGDWVLDTSIPVVEARLERRQRLAAHESRYLLQHAPGPVKVALPTAMTFAQGAYVPGITDRHYPDWRALLADLVGILRDEAAALAAEGVAYIQVDAPRYTHYVDPAERERLSQRASGLDATAALGVAIEADNQVLDAARAGGSIVGVHLCRGNARSSWLISGGYEPIAEQVFGSLRADRLLLEYDSERAGGFEPLRFVPKDKTVVLGLVTTKDGRLESADDLLRRIDEASRYVEGARLALSPQCGFASTEEGNELTWDDQRRKLELVVETARRAWG